MKGLYKNVCLLLKSDVKYLILLLNIRMITFYVPNEIKLIYIFILVGYF